MDSLPGFGHGKRSASVLTAKSNGLRKPPRDIQKAASAVQMNVEQERVSLILKDDDYDLDDVSLVR